MSLVLKIEDFIFTCVLGGVISHEVAMEVLKKTKVVYAGSNRANSSSGMGL